MSENELKPKVTFSDANTEDSQSVGVPPDLSQIMNSVLRNIAENSGDSCFDVNNNSKKSLRKKTRKVRGEEDPEYAKIIQEGIREIAGEDKEDDEEDDEEDVEDEDDDDEDEELDVKWEVLNKLLISHINLTKSVLILIKEN